MAFALVFPGQGSQFVGMGVDLANNFTAAKKVFQEVDDSLKQSLFKIISDGPENDLMLTENTQPALMAVSMAFISVLNQESGYPIVAKSSILAGHSLGEYTALTVSGAFNLAESARLLKIRGQAMQRAVPVGQGAMAALLGSDLDTAAKICQAAASKTNQICVPANDNSVGQIVISGNKTAIDEAINLASTYGIKRAVLLPVSAPFHCPLMESAAQRMADALMSVQIKSLQKPVVTNFNAQVTSDYKLIPDLLVKQVVGMVRWRESIIQMKNQRITDYIEIGAGKVLSGLIKRIDKDANCLNCGEVGHIESIVKYINNQ